MHLGRILIHGSPYSIPPETLTLESPQEKATLEKLLKTPAKPTHKINLTYAHLAPGRTRPLVMLGVVPGTEVHGFVIRIKHTDDLILSQVFVYVAVTITSIGTTPQSICSSS